MRLARATLFPGKPFWLFMFPSLFKVPLFTVLYHPIKLPFGFPLVEILRSSIQSGNVVPRSERPCLTPWCCLELSSYLGALLSDTAQQKGSVGVSLTGTSSHICSILGSPFWNLWVPFLVGHSAQGQRLCLAPWSCLEVDRPLLEVQTHTVRCCCCSLRRPPFILCRSWQPKWHRMTSNARGIVLEKLLWLRTEVVAQVASTQWNVTAFCFFTTSFIYSLTTIWMSLLPQSMIPVTAENL